MNCYSLSLGHKNIDLTEYKTIEYVFKLRLVCWKIVGFAISYIKI